ncbi:Tfp pilus assembly protein FimT/FimU [Marinimicrobium sp. LS-A18]|uniref:pilus assembly FimT family protein n=1 Tax=Marinimicrobium sp. LS-A18 TaxID=1381596 RepID=UPI00187C07CF|nr:type II secretion system protein [Marinimicrobium sp. LS-A18]
MPSACAMYNGRKSSGFSLIELIAVIILLGIISVVALPRFYNTDAAAIQSARDQVLSALFTAQQLAMARASTSNTIQVNVVTSGLNVTENGTPVAATGGTYPLTLPEGVTITTGTGTYSFDKLGRTDPGQIVMTRGSTSATVRVEASGYAYTP